MRAGPICRPQQEVANKHAKRAPDYNPDWIWRPPSSAGGLSGCLGEGAARRALDRLCRSRTATTFSGRPDYLLPDWPVNEEAKREQVAALAPLATR